MAVLAAGKRAISHLMASAHIVASTSPESRASRLLQLGASKRERPGVCPILSQLFELSYYCAHGAKVACVDVNTATHTSLPVGGVQQCRRKRYVVQSCRIEVRSNNQIQHRLAWPLDAAADLAAAFGHRRPLARITREGRRIQGTCISVLLVVHNTSTCYEYVTPPQSGAPDPRVDSKSFRDRVLEANRPVGERAHRIIAYSQHTVVRASAERSGVANNGTTRHMHLSI
jgi:hypothetical protein